MKVYLTQSLEQSAVKLLEAVATVEMNTSGTQLTREQFLDAIKDVDGLILGWHTDRMDKEAFDVAKNLKVVARRGSGYDDIDIKEATSRNIPVILIPIHTPTIADLAFGLLIATARRIPRLDAFVREGKWTKGGTWVAHKFMGFDVNHKTIGIIGMGKIGLEIAKRALGFDMTVLYYDITRKRDVETALGIKYTQLDELLQKSDFVSVHCALNNNTRGLIGAREISLMKDTAVIIVVARGGIVDQEALYRALSENKLGGAGLDVFEPEPISSDDPLLSLENVVFSPHIGVNVADMREKQSLAAAADVVRVLKGETPIYLYPL